MQNAEVSATLLKSHSTTNAFPAIKKILVVESVFGNSYRWVDWTAQLFFKRNATKDVFLIIFQNFHNNFSNIFSMYEDDE